MIIRFKAFISEEKEIHHDMTFMRGNPLHKGHQTVIDQVKKSAKEHGGDHSVVFSGTQDKDKNPMSSEDKLKFGKKAFPNTNISVASKAKPTILYNASDLHKSGVTHLTLHVGSDRVDQFKDLLNKYNGAEGKHGYYNFKSIEVKPVGAERKEEGEGIASYSASKMRGFAKEGNLEDFKKMSPDNLNDKDKEEMYNSVRKGMKISE
jgi:hypothetical protein